MSGQIFGFTFLLVGLVGLSSYSEELPFRFPFFYKELQPMQERWGKAIGTAMHVLAYVVAPLGFAFFFFAGMVH